MPSDGGLEFTVEALKHKAEYWAARRRFAEGAGRPDLARRAAELEQRAHERLFARETSADRRALVRFARDDAEEQRHAARQQLEAVRMDPVYDLYRDWAQRVDTGTQYDARTWRSTGRLVPVTQRMRYEAGGGARRETVDWTDILDRAAQERGIDVQELPARFTRMRRQLTEAQRQAALAEQSRREASALAKELRGRG